MQRKSSPFRRRKSVVGARDRNGKDGGEEEIMLVENVKRREASFLPSCEPKEAEAWT